MEAKRCTCGNDPRQAGYLKNGKPVYFVYCSNLGCDKITATYTRESEAVEAWNTIVDTHRWRPTDMGKTTRKVVTDVMRLAYGYVKDKPVWKCKLECGHYRYIVAPWYLRTLKCKTCEVDAQVNNWRERRERQDLIVNGLAVAALWLVGVAGIVATVAVGYKLAVWVWREIV